jgi:hypothetical protein
VRTRTSPLQAEARAAWARRVLRVGGMIQAGFGTFWLVRGSMAISTTVPWLAVALGGTALLVLAYGARSTARLAPRPRGEAAQAIEREITIATVVQLAASFALPAAVIAAGHADWVLGSVAMTLAPLLIWFDVRLDLPRYRVAGWTLLVVPVALALAFSGDALIATTGIGGGALLVATAIAGFRQLQRVEGDPGDRIPRAVPQS